MAACAIQKRLLADILNPKTTSKDRAALAKSWDVLENRKRIFKMKPLPGSMRPEQERARRPRRFQAGQFREPGEVDFSASESSETEASSTRARLEATVYAPKRAARLNERNNKTAPTPLEEPGPLDSAEPTIKPGGLAPSPEPLAPSPEPLAPSPEPL